jgi:hypothetical protein
MGEDSSFSERPSIKPAWRPSDGDFLRAGAHGPKRPLRSGAQKSPPDGPKRGLWLATPTFWMGAAEKEAKRLLSVWLGRPRLAYANLQKFFASFLQKRRPSFP